MRRLAILALSAFLLACQYDPHAHLYTTSRPDRSAVLGTYVLERETVHGADIAELGAKKPSLTLRGDGTFVADRIPPSEMGVHEQTSFTKLVSGTGTWRIEQLGTVDSGWRSGTVWGIRLESADVKFDYSSLKGSKEPYGLIFTIGDPDSGEALFFERSK